MKKILVTGGAGFWGSRLCDRIINKGLEVLLKAFDELRNFKHDWEAHLIGNGSLKYQLIEIKNIVVKNFTHPEN